MRPPLRRPLSLAGLCLALCAPPALAQQQPPVPVPADPAPPQTDSPLTTGTRPGDVPTTAPQTVNPGLDGDAPADEMPAPRGSNPPAVEDESRTGSMAPPPGATTERGVPQSRTPAAALSAERARTLIGQPVLGSDGKSAGTLRDFVTGGNGQGLTAAVLDRNGKLVALPADRLQVEAAQRAGEAPTLHAAMTAAEAGLQPDFSYAAGAKTLLGREK